MHVPVFISPEKSKKITIAIDGYSSTGKSTVAKRLAKALQYVYVDTGAMYRAVTYFAMENRFIDGETFDKKALIHALPQIHLSFVYNAEKGFSEMYLNGKNIEEAIRSIAVSNWVSPVATIPEVRSYLVQIQRKMGKDKGVVMDGRDIGSVVFPDAEVKIFLTAKPEVKAERRYKEMQEKGLHPDYNEILENIITRDRIDSTREDSPLIQVPDAVAIDVSNLDKEAEFQAIYTLAQKALGK